MDTEGNNEELPVVLYTSADGQVRVNALVKDETLWMTQADMRLASSLCLSAAGCNAYGGCRRLSPPDLRAWRCNG